MFTAHHIDWTKPSGGTICPDRDLELLTAVYSVLKWQKHNGAVVLHTDRDGYARYKALGLVDLWDHVETEILDNFDFSAVNYKSFRAAGKFAVLSAIDLPAFMMDLDLVVMGGLEQTNFDSTGDIAFHNSVSTGMPGMTKLYPGKEGIYTPAGYVYPEGLDWGVPVSSCNFYYMNNRRLRDEYVHEALRFMRNNPTNRKSEEMMFIEQRFLRMLVKKGNYVCNSMLCRGIRHGDVNYWDLIGPGCPVDPAAGRFFIHLSAGSGGSYEEKRDTFCRMLLRRLYDEFGDVFDILCRIDVLQKYVASYAGIGNTQRH